MHGEKVINRLYQENISLFKELELEAPDWSEGAFSSSISKCLGNHFDLKSSHLQMHWYNAMRLEV